MDAKEADGARRMKNLKRPAALIVVEISLFIIVVLAIISFGMSYVGDFEQPQRLLVPSLILTTISLMIALFFPFMAFIGVRRGWRVGPILVTFVDVWWLSGALQYPNIVGWVGVPFAVVSAACIWLPSARRFAAEQRVRVSEAKLGQHP